MVRDGSDAPPHHEGQACSVIRQPVLFPPVPPRGGPEIAGPAGVRTGGTTLDVTASPWCLPAMNTAVRNTRLWWRTS